MASAKKHSTGLVVSIIAIMNKMVINNDDQRQFSLNLV